MRKEIAAAIQARANGKFVKKDPIAPLEPVERFDGTLDGIAFTIKAPEETLAGVRRRLVNLLRNDESMDRFVEVADSFLKRKNRAYPSLDVIAATAGLEHAEVVGSFARALHRFSFDYSRIIAASAMPRVMSTLAHAAADVNGHSDRTLFLRATGHLPTGGGKPTNINVQQTTIARAESSALAIANTPSSLPNFEDDVKKNVSALRTVDVLPG
jgi:hypothetical protein